MSFKEKEIFKMGKYTQLQNKFVPYTTLLYEYNAYEDRAQDAVVYLLIIGIN